MLLARRAGAGHAARGRAALAEDVLLVESTGNRPDLLSVYGIAREVAALYDLELAPPPGDRPGARPETSASTSGSRTSSGCPRYVGRLFRDVAIGAVAAVAAGAAQRAGHAPDLQRRRRDELRHARARQPAARVRLRDSRRGADRRPPSEEGEELRTLDGERELEPEDLLIADAERARSRSPGSWAARRREIGDGRPTSCSRRRTSSRRDLPHLRAPPPAHRGLEPLGEGRRPDLAEPAAISRPS